MDGSIRLGAIERKTLLSVVKTASAHEQRLRAHVLLLLDDGWAWSTIAAVLFTSSSTINRCASDLPTAAWPPFSRYRDVVGRSGAEAF